MQLTAIIEGNHLVKKENKVDNAGKVLFGTKVWNVYDGISKVDGAKLIKSFKTKKEAIAFTNSLNM